MELNLTKKAEMSMEKVISKFQQGDLSPLIQVAGLKRDPPVPFDRWSYRNRVIAYAQSDSTDLRGSKQWRDAGRSWAGARASFILGPLPVKKEDPDTGEKKYIHIGRYASIPVFPVEMTKGEPLPESQYTPVQLPPLWDVAEKLNVDVEYMPNLPGRLGDFAPGRVHLDSHDPYVWFHELGHAAHTHIDNGRREGDTAYRETVADLVGCILSEFYGVRDNTGNTWAYIAAFNDDPMKAITEALETVTRILEFLLPEENWRGKKEVA
ncbi:hypothetical protein ACFLWA_03725 [Chloroflexota bacterium]